MALFFLTNGGFMFKGWKTFTYAAGTMLAVLMVPQVQELIAQYPTISVIINGAVIAALRFITTTPVIK